MKNKIKIIEPNLFAKTYMSVFFFLILLGSVFRIIKWIIDFKLINILIIFIILVFNVFIGWLWLAVFTCRTVFDYEIKECGVVGIEFELI